jgi:hypothetical protein
VFLILPSTLLLAALISGPALWHALVTGDLSISVALARFLIAVPVSGLMLSLLRGLTAGYRAAARRRALEAAVAERSEAGQEAD